MSGKIPNPGTSPVDHRGMASHYAGKGSNKHIGNPLLGVLGDVFLNSKGMIKNGTIMG